MAGVVATGQTERQTLVTTAPVQMSFAVATSPALTAQTSEPTTKPPVKFVEAPGASVAKVNTTGRAGVRVLTTTMSRSGMSPLLRTVPV